MNEHLEMAGLKHLEECQECAQRLGQFLARFLGPFFGWQNLPEERMKELGLKEHVW